MFSKDRLHDFVTKSLHYNRRFFLKTAASGLALPFFTGVCQQAFAQQVSKPPIRLFIMSNSYGLEDNPARRQMDWVFPYEDDTQLSDSDLGSILSVFVKYKQNMCVPIGVHNTTRSNLNGVQGHTSVCYQILTGSKPVGVTSNSSVGDSTSLSLDVVLGNWNQQQTGGRFLYPYLAVADRLRASRPSYTHNEHGKVYPYTAGSVLQAAFNTGDKSDQSYAYDFDLEMMQLVADKVAYLGDQYRSVAETELLGVYSDGVEDLSRQLKLRIEQVCDAPELASLSEPYQDSSYKDMTKMSMLVASMFQCHLTSVVNYMPGSTFIDTHRYAFLEQKYEVDNPDISTAFRQNGHTLSHNRSTAGHDARAMVQSFHAEKVLHVLDQLSMTPDLDGGTMFDNSIFLWAPQHGKPVHKAKNYPFLVIAGKNTGFKGGYAYNCRGRTLNDFLLTIAHGAGMTHLDSFGGFSADGYDPSTNNGPIESMLKST